MFVSVGSFYTFNVNPNITDIDYVIGQTFLARYSPMFIIDTQGETLPAGGFGPTLNVLFMK